MEYLFVYGTLQENFNNEYARLLHSNAEIVGKASFPGRLYKISWYPGAIFDETSEFRVYGTVFMMKEASFVLKKIDYYEGVGSEFNYPNEYIRRKVTVILDNQQEKECWVYLYNSAVNNDCLIESGVFSAH